MGREIEPKRTIELIPLKITQEDINTHEKSTTVVTDPDELIKLYENIAISGDMGEEF